MATGLSSLEAIVNAYILLIRSEARRELNLFGRTKQPSLREAIRAAALSQVDGKRHSHQRRIPGDALGAAAAGLEKTALSTASRFEELHDRVETAIGTIRKIGPLAIYDIAQRIGSYLGLAPRLVYLHAGTKDGARALNLQGKVVESNELPRAFAA
jgi:hypothetical protein